ncbi:MAG TPA: hypothetical protein VFT69_17185 [Pseudolabrys sp.]|nr:hypothetical protein [Pseudolabrys sp.]
MAKAETISIDARVALQEERQRNQALEAFYANRVLVLGQRIFDLEHAKADLEEKIESLTGEAEPPVDPS